MEFLDSSGLGQKRVRACYCHDKGMFSSFGSQLLSHQIPGCMNLNCQKGPRLSFILQGIERHSSMGWRDKAATWNERGKGSDPGNHS